MPTRRKNPCDIQVPNDTQLVLIICESYTLTMQSVHTIMLHISINETVGENLRCENGFFGHTCAPERNTNGKAVKPRGGDLVLLEIQPKVYEVFQLLGFSQFFNIKENLDEAVSFFAARGEEGKGAIFPRIFKCPICSKKLRASKAGRFRCSECKTILAIDNAGQVFLG